MVCPVLLSTSVPMILKPSIEDVADVFSKLYGDWAGTLGVHSCPAAGGVSAQPAAPSIPALRKSNVIVMFGAAANVIKSGWSRSVVSGGPRCVWGVGISLVTHA